MATKIKDGLFIGDAEASQDADFIELNKITFVINCAGRQLLNLWEQHGLHYLTFPWTSDPDCILFDGGNVVVMQISNFIDEALKKGESVLVHSFDGTGRCVACVTAYLMFRFRWGFEKALDFVCSKRPDAAPNAGFVQQLYHLDLRLCEQWFQNTGPLQSERLRHDQWISIVPSVEERRDKRRTRAGGHHRHSGAANQARGEETFDNEGTAVATGAAAHVGGMKAAFPSLGELTEAQEEEIVLVHSFLNSQPQIDALPPGRANYEDHVSKELHWVDRPRLDKLVAAGRLSHDDPHQHVIPISPRTGRAVPERPGNSSYHALSREFLSSSKVTHPTGILKAHMTKDPAESTEPRSRHTRALEAEADGVPSTASGDDAATTVSGDSGGREVVTPPSQSRRAKGADKVVVEDLSDGVDASKSENTSGGDLSNSRSRLSPHETDDSSGEGDGAAFRPAESRRSGAYAADESTPGSEPSRRARMGDAVLSNGGKEESPHEIGSAEGVGRQDRQAWDTRAWDTSGPNGERATEAPSERGTTKVSMSARSGEKGVKALTGQWPPATGAAHGMSRGVDSHRREVALDEVRAHNVDKKGASGTKGHDRKDGAASTTRAKMIRRGSEGSLTFPSKITDLLPREKQQASFVLGHRGVMKEKVTRCEVPGPGWGPDGMLDNADAPGPGGRPREHVKSAGGARDSLNGGDVSRMQGSTSNDGMSSHRRSNGSLQQLAQAPNPRQRRLPSPRSHQEPGQIIPGASLSSSHSATRGTSAVTTPGLSQECSPGWSSSKKPSTASTIYATLDHFQQRGIKQSTPEESQLFTQKRPSSAPSQRPDSDGQDGEDNRASSYGWATGASAPPLTEAHPRAPGSIGSSTSGYPAHDLMLSASTRTMEEHDRCRPRVESGRKASVPRGGQTTGPKVAALTCDNSARATASSPMDERADSLSESPRLANVGAGATGKTELVRDSDKRGRGNCGGANGGPLPRDFRSSAPPTQGKTRTRDHGTTSSPTNGSSRSNTREADGSRGLGTNGSPVHAKINSGFLPASTGALPLPSRRGTTNLRPSSSGGETDSVRWASPAPCGTNGNRGVPNVSYPRPGAVESRGSGGRGGSSRGVSMSHNTRPCKSSTDGYPVFVSEGAQQPSRIPLSRTSRAGGPPVYRSGSPAPTRGRRSAASASSTGGGLSAPVRKSTHHMAQGQRRQQRAPGIPPGYRGYVEAEGYRAGGDDVSRAGMTSAAAAARRRHSPAANDGRCGATGGARNAYQVPARSNVTKNRSSGAMPSASAGALLSGRRPFTSGGLPDRGRSGGEERAGKGRAGRSPSPAPRPSSASVRRRSPSPVPAHHAGSDAFGRSSSRTGVHMDPGFDRPRWK